MKNIYLLLLGLMLTVNSFAYYTPNTGVKYTMADLVTNSGGHVVFEEGVYKIISNVFITPNDTLEITTDLTVKFTAGTVLDVNGTLIINPPTNVLFTELVAGAGYNGVRIDSSAGTKINKLTFEYASAFRIADCSPVITNSIFSNNTTSTTLGSGAITLFRSAVVIDGCQFLNNKRPAINGGSNINNAPKIYNSYFFGNASTAALNQPQINLGATSSGNDTTKIINNQIIGNGQIKSGGIAFLPTGNVYTVISGNIIRKNRYGISFNGGSNINSMVSYNVIDSNNIENLPDLGGSGINFTTGSTGTAQNSIVTGNIFRANLYGITVVGPGGPNVGNTTNTDTSDNGKNQFINNVNATYPQAELYNNGVSTVYAQNNYWNTDLETEAEDKIYHITDNTAKGLVIYTPIMLSSALPLKLVSFTATANNKNVLLGWKTSNEINTNYFVVERSTDGTGFTQAGTITANNTATLNTYSYNDYNVLNSTLYYRLKIVDKDAKLTYSPVIKVNAGTSKQPVKIYPTVLTSQQFITAVIYSDDEQKIAITFIDNNGKKLAAFNETLTKGSNNIMLPVTANLPAGTYHINFTGKNLQQTLSVVK